MHDSEQEHSGITGCRVTYESTIFYNEANKFSIIVVKTNDPRIPLQACSDRYYGDRMLRFTAVGYELPRTKAVELELDGEWVESKYGYQLQVEQWQEIVPQTADGLLAYLGSGLIKGIGPKTAEDIVATFGPDTLNILDNEPEKLLQIRGITEGKLKDIEESYAESRVLRNLMSLLGPFKITPATALKIYQHFGPACVDILKKCPYDLCQISGFGFKRVDGIVRKTDNRLHSTERIKGAVLYTLEDARSKSGHLFLPSEDLVKETLLLLNAPIPIPEQRVRTEEVQETLQQMILHGAAAITAQKQAINDLNVFPVPDGDTGTNMSLTMISAMKEVCKNTTNTMEALCQDLTKGALRGARGNSGVILSQILKGFANVVSPQEELDIKNFARALKSGVELAYSAVAKPKEGTMLTVIRVMTEHALEISKKPLTYDNFLSALIEKGEEILAQTPEMLDVLKKAGVVDSGGYGIIMIFKGMLKGYRNEEIEGAEDYVPTPVSLNLASGSNKLVEDIQIDYENLDDIEFAYCTEFFIINLKKKTTVSDIDKLREKFNNIGDSTLVIGDLSLVKVHVHTNNPGTALSYALQLGEVDKIKIENMLEQNRELKAKYEAERKNIGILTICSGEGMASIFKDLGVDRVVEGGQTMNPSAEDIALAVNKINAENVIILPNNKNIILAAEQSRSLVKKKTVYVVQSTNIPQGLSAMLAFNTEINIAENIENMNEALSTVKSGSVTFAVRTSKIDDVEVKEGDVIGLFESKIAAVGSSPEAVTNELIDKMIDEDDEIMTLYYGEEVTAEQAEAFCEELAERYPDFEVSVHCGGQSLYYYLISIE